MLFVVVMGIFHTGFVSFWFLFCGIRTKGHKIRNNPKIVAKSPKWRLLVDI